MKKHSTKSKGRAWWTARVDAFERSGPSQREFCQTQGLKLSTFSKWRRRIAKERFSSGQLVETSPEFIEVELPQVHVPLVRVTLGEVTVDFETLPPPAWVAELAARGAGRC